MPHFDLLIRNATLVLPWGETRTDLAVHDGRIAALGAAPTDEARETIDATGLHVLPGIIDPHVHFRDSGQGPLDPSGETLESGTRGAVLGGVTTIFDMPNTTPALTDATTLAIKQTHAERAAWCDVGLYVGATKTNITELAALERGRGVCAVKVFAGSSTGDLLVEDDTSIEAVLAAGTRRVAFHSEDEPRLRARKPLFESGGSYADHAKWRDEEAAFLGTRRIVALAERRNRPIHILHVSTEEELDWLDPHRAHVSIEILVNHLTQHAPDCYDRLGGYAVMNPPLRDRRHLEAAWRAVADGRVDTIGSDHAPHPRAAKERPWPATAAGLTGVQTLLPIMLDHVASGRLTLSRLADLMSAGPARIYGLRRKGRIARGHDADLTLVDLAARRTIEPAWLASPCGWSPFEGTSVTGWPIATIVRGHVVMRDDEVVGDQQGRLADFD
jgi:dihydroorotase